MKDFAFYLSRAIRCSSDSKDIPTVTSSSTTNQLVLEEDDWTPHYIDYTKLKYKLKDFLKRRKVLRKLLKITTTSKKTSHDLVVIVKSRLTEDEINLLLSCMNDHQQRQKQQPEAKRRLSLGEYFNYEDFDNESAKADSPTARLEELIDQDEASISEVISKTERNEFCDLLDNENKKATIFYRTQLDIVRQLLSNLDRFVRENHNDNTKNMTEATATTTSNTSHLIDEPTSVMDVSNTGAGAGAGAGVGAASDVGAAVEVSGIDADADVPKITEKKSQSQPRTAEERETIIKELEYVRDEIIELYAFAVVNIICMRQILIRYDALVRSFEYGMPLSQWYFVKTRRIIEYFDLALLDAIKTTYMTKMEQLLVTGSLGSEVSDCLQEFSYQFEMFNDLLQQTLESLNESASGNIVFRDRFIQDLRYYFMIGSFRGNLLMEPKILLMRGRHLKEEMDAVVKWRKEKKRKADKHIIKASSRSYESKQQEEKDDGPKIDPENVIPLLLNLISCFIYMVNNYVIEPSSAYYANALGSNDALSGLIMALGPWCALISAFGYSIWTNVEYKKPICFAAVLQCIGNLLYANAYKYKSMEMCLIGRAIAGLGASKIINRRYVADATPFALRTASNAAFGLSMALGAAMGPALAIVLDYFEFEFHLPFLGVQYFNGMTGPGYVMSASWFVFLIIILIFFGEPKRSGLEELKQREAAAAAAAGADARSASPTARVVDTTSLIAASKDKENQKGNDGIGDDEKEKNYVVPNLSNTTSKSSFDSEYINHPSIVASYSDASYSDRSNDGEDDRNKNDNSYAARLCQMFSKLCCTSETSNCFRHITKAVILCMSLIFMKRIALESIAGSTSIVTKNRYGWSIKNVGTLHFVNGLLVIPVSILAGYLSKFYQDRQLALWTLSITLFGMLIMIDTSDIVTLFNASDADDGDNNLMQDDYYHFNDNEVDDSAYSPSTPSYNEGSPFAVGPVRYISGSLIAFSGVEACESFVASLLSKVIPSALATGTLNAGLLATIVGTAGRATGDLIITALGLISLRQLLNLLMIPGAILVVISIGLVRHYYDILDV